MLDGRNSFFRTLKFKCFHEIANEISNKTASKHFLVVVCIAYGTLNHLNKNKKLVEMKMKNGNSKNSLQYTITLNG
jgi:hypothetical protein